MQYVPDIIALAVIVLFAVSGAKKGLIRSCADFLGALLAMIGAGILSAPAAQWVYVTFFREPLVEKISAAVLGLGAGEAVQAVFSSFPDVIQRALDAAGITQGSVVAQLQSGADGVAEGIADALSPMLIGFVRVLALLVLFILLIVVIRAIAALLSGLFELPVLHGINVVFGAVFGALMAVLVLWILLACLQVFTPMFSAGMQEKIREALAGSILSGMLYSFNPAYWLIG
ncbi:MAG: CvpA family protein [Hominenteromicrobium sp.]